MASLSFDEQDPDAQAAITDFADYTEYYPSDLFRSLTLIGKLDGAYRDNVERVHKLTTTYGALPTLTGADKPDAQTLRRDISTELDKALRCREATYAEALRLCNLTENLSNQLQNIRAKLEAQPKPPLKQAAPPQSRRNRKDEERSARVKALQDGAQRPRTRPTSIYPRRRVIVPGQVLPPRDPKSPETSDAESEPELVPTPAVRAPTRIVLVEKEATPRPRPRKSEEPKAKPPAATATPTIVRMPGMGTNVHSTVAGISVTNAMLQLHAPPSNPRLGSTHAPWTKLTEWELHQIRKRMKKNADWLPSPVMVTRELKDRGRGEEARQQAKEAASHGGAKFVDEEPLTFVRQTNGSVPEYDSSAADDDALNRGMKLNEAKKLKRERVENSSFDDAGTDKKSKKRGAEADTKEEPISKKIRLGFKPFDPSGKPSRASAGPFDGYEVNGKGRLRAAPTIRLTMPTKKAASAEPEKPRPSYRRPSDTDTLSTKLAASSRQAASLTETAASRRHKRPTPGILASHDGGGAKVSVGKRKTVAEPSGAGAAHFAEIDPNEPRYCICNDVSHGVMIACENAACKIEWFHVGCIGLDGIEKKIRLSRLHWYCPNCRAKFGVTGDGIVRK